MQGFDKHHGLMITIGLNHHSFLSLHFYSIKKYQYLEQSGQPNFVVATNPIHLDWLLS